MSIDRYYDPLLYYNGWNRTIRLENGIMVWEKGNISTIKPLKSKPLPTFLKYTWGIFPMLSLMAAFSLFIFYLIKFKEQKYKDIKQDITEDYPRFILYTSAYFPIIFFSGFMMFQVYELLLVREQKDPETTVLNYFNHLDFQRFEKAFHLFAPSPMYPLDQYLLEKSVNDGGLLPSYAKLDSISVREINKKRDSAILSVYTRWNTSLGFQEKMDTMNLIYQKNKWYIIPKSIIPEIPDEQMRSYTFTLFKKQGKRLISSYPTVKDDRVEKPFVTFLQANLIKNNGENFVTGEILNADDIPVNIALKLSIKFDNDSILHYYPETNFIYNLAPKGSSFFQIDIKGKQSLDLSKIKSIQLIAETDVSERGYIHGGTLGYNVEDIDSNHVTIQSEFYNELATEINIPGILVAEKDKNGMIWQTKLLTHTNAVRSGLHLNFQHKFEKIGLRAKRETFIPLDIFVNGQSRKLLEMNRDDNAQKNKGISAIPHSFISQEIYLQ